MRASDNPNISHNELRTGVLRPALASIPDACRYVGGVSRAKFYSDILPLLETVHIGTRHFVVVTSMDRLIAELKDAASVNDLRLDDRAVALSTLKGTLSSPTQKKI
jgi:hypothetical protein